MSARPVGELATAAERIEAGAQADLGILGLTFVVGVLALLWALWGGSLEAVAGRVEVLVHLWPLWALWLATLAIRSMSTSRARREMIRAEGAVAAAVRVAALRRAEVGAGHIPDRGFGTGGTVPPRAATAAP